MQFQFFFFSENGLSYPWCSGAKKELPVGLSRIIAYEGMRYWLACNKLDGGRDHHIHLLSDFHISVTWQAISSIPHFAPSGGIRFTRCVGSLAVLDVDECYFSMLSLFLITFSHVLH